MKILMRLAMIMALLLVGATGYWAWLGYFGGALYVPLRAVGSPPAGQERLGAVIISGDMGFKVGMGPKIAERLTAHGIPVVGVNSLVYFNRRRTPIEIRAFVAAAIRRGLAQAEVDRIVLVGQSFGADMVHVGLVGLTPELRAKLALVALVVPTETVDYRASPLELAGLVKPDAPALPTARQLTWVPTLCVQGIEERDSLCPSLTAPNVHKVALPGGHPLHYDADALYAQLCFAMDRASRAARPAQAGGR